MKKYTILSFCFGNYDLLREPTRVDPYAEYIYVTDRQISSTHWKVIVDEKLKGKDPIYASYYVRHHPFEYATTDITAVVDASIQINYPLNDIVSEFDASGADYSALSTVYKSDEHKMDFWKAVKRSNPSRISDADLDSLYGLIAKMHQQNWRGAIGQAFIMYRNTPIMHRFSRHVWRYLMALGHDGKPNRLDEVVIHKLLPLYEDRLGLFIISMQLIQSSYMTYCGHMTFTPLKIYSNYDQFFYLCNKPVSPVRFDKNVSYPRSYYHRTEAILLTKYLNPNDLKEWLDHHINKVKFDHIHIFDNESDYDIRKVIEPYGDRVSYQKIYGHPRQYRLYDAYINNISSAEWVMPIDDDEFLDIGDFDSVYDAISYYGNKFPHMMILGIRWKHLFPEKFHSERQGKVLDYCKVENPELAKTFIRLGDTTIKCIVRRYGEVHYEETWENPAGGHVPKHTCFLGAVMCDGRAVRGCGIPDCPKNLDDERIRLLHCRYKGYSEWKAKYMNTDEEKNCRTVCDSSIRKKDFEFNNLLETLE